MSGDHPSDSDLLDLTIGVDVGGTKIAAGLVDAHGTVTAQVALPTPARDVAGTVADLARSLVEAHRDRVRAVGIGAAGLISADRATVVFAPNLSWSGEPVGSRVAEATGLRVVVENDANAAAWGEYRFGAARDVGDTLMVTVGTGVGAGIIAGSRLVRGGHGMAAELGHLRVVLDGVACGCGQRGCLEQYASGSALVREARARWRANPPGPVAAGVLAQAGRSLDTLTGPDVTAAALAGDPDAIDLLAELGRWLGEGIASAAALLDPTRVVIGGGVVAAGEALLGPTREALARSLPGAGHRGVPDVVAAELGNGAGLVGAADLARELS